MWQDYRWCYLCDLHLGTVVLICTIQSSANMQLLSRYVQHHMCDVFHLIFFCLEYSGGQTDNRYSISNIVSYFLESSIQSKYKCKYCFTALNLYIALHQGNYEHGHTQIHSQTERGSEPWSCVWFNLKVILQEVTKMFSFWDTVSPRETPCGTYWWLFYVWHLTPYRNSWFQGFSSSQNYTVQQPLKLEQGSELLS